MTCEHGLFSADGTAADNSDCTPLPRLFNRIEPARKRCIGVSDLSLAQAFHASASEKEQKQQ
jgi:hypothetical protein